jgi:hypothetical protein
MNLSSTVRDDARESLISNSAHSSSPTRDSSQASEWNQTQRSIASLVLFIHLFCLGVALTANQAPSPLQERLLYVFRPYTQLLNFDVSFIRFDLTQETGDDADQRIEYLPENKDPANPADWVLLGSGARGTDRWQRYQRLAGVMSFFAAREDDATAAVFASAIATHLHQQQGVAIDQIRVRRHLLQSPDQVRGADVAQRDPSSPNFFQEVYRAQVIDGGAAVQKVEERGQVAPPTRASGQPSVRNESRGAIPASKPEPKTTN